MKTQDFPYNECEDCKTLTDCPYRVVMEDGLGSVFPPDDCPFAMDRLKEASKHRKLHKTNPS